MNNEPYQTRRHFFNDCAVGVGSIALANLLAEQTASARPAAGALAPRQSHFPAKAKSIIYLFMAGGPSQFELFEN